MEMKYETSNMQFSQNLNLGDFAPSTVLYFTKYNISNLLNLSIIQIKFTDYSYKMTYFQIAHEISFERLLGIKNGKSTSK